MKKEIGAKPIIFPTPVLIIGTYNEDGTPNAMNVAWGGICGSVPPAVSIAVRKERKTYENICSRKAFTVNIPNEDLMDEADFFGVVSGKKMNKFDHVDLKTVKAENVDAPYIEEFPVVAECKVLESIEVGEHVIIIGEIVNVLAEDSVLNEKGVIDVEKVNAIGFDPADNCYTTTGKVVGKAFSAGVPILKRAKGEE